MDDPVEAAFADHWTRLLALLVAQYRRLDLAEDALADAFEAAATRWVTDGTPANPPAWLLTVARRRVLDRLRAEAVAARKEPLLVVESEVSSAAARAMADPGDLVSDERLRLVLLCAHPALAPETAAALSLRLVVGVPTADVARLFLVSEATMAARLTRAKRRLAASGVPFALPGGTALDERLETVTTVVYLAFTAGYAPSSGDDVVRVSLAGEAVRLLRVVRELAPVSTASTTLDVLLALVLLQHSRRDARVGPDGRPVLLTDQDRRRWRADEIEEALALLAPLVPRRLTGRAGELQLQALIAAEHALAPTAGATRWDRIAAHYAELEDLTGSPVVRLNRAVAVAEAEGPAAGLALLVGLEDRLGSSHRVPAVRGELQARSGDHQAARTSYERALELCGNGAERSLLHDRLAALR